jgi:hypothetical protein
VRCVMVKFVCMRVNSLPVGVIEIYKVQRNGKLRFLLRRVFEERLNLLNKGVTVLKKTEDKIRPWLNPIFISVVLV